MTTGPWDPMASGARRTGYLRASDADRERAIEILKAAFVQGMLAKDELGTRAGEALASRTYAELNAVTGDLPGTVKARPPRETGRPRARRVAAARDGGRRPVNRRAIAWAACLAVVLPALGAAFLTFYGGFVVLLVCAFLGATITADP